MSATQVLINLDEIHVFAPHLFYGHFYLAETLH